MRAVLAAAMALLVLSTAVAPHAHEGVFRTHSCFACIAANAKEATRETPDVAPRTLVVATVPDLPASPCVTGYPLGAVPGQSPPRA